MVQVPGRHFFRNLIEKRWLLYQLIRRDFERRFVGSAGGWLWSVIHPLVLLASWTFVFHVCLGMTVPNGEGTDNYTLFLFCGYLPWMLFADTIQRSSTCLLESSNLITKTVFPSEMLPVSVFFSSLVSHVLTLAIAWAAVAAMTGFAGPGPVTLIPYMALLAMLAIGLGWIVSAFQVYLRDTSQAVMVLLTLWFWITPIFINLEQIPAGFRWLPRWNPLSAFVRAYRDQLLHAYIPDGRDLAYAAAVSLTVFVAGGLVFRQLKRGFADVL